MRILACLAPLALLQTLTLAVPVSPSSSFNSNLLSSLMTPKSKVSAVAHSSHLLPDGTLVIAGVIVYPAHHEKVFGVTDAPAISDLSESISSERTAAFVARTSVQGELMWMLRVAPVTSSNKVSIAVDDDEQIFIAGHTTGLVNDEGVITYPGAFLIAVSPEGVAGPVAVHYTVGDEYVGINWHERRRDELLLLCRAKKHSPVFEMEAQAPTKTGLCIVRVSKRSLNVMEVKPLSLAAGLVQDKFWSLGAADDGRTLYVGVKRQTVQNWIHSFTPTILAVAVDSLVLTAEPRALPKDLQNTMVVRGDRKGVYVGYVSRTHNRENLVVRRLGKRLEDIDWDYATGTLFEKEIVMDLEYTRSIRSDVMDMLVDGSGNVRVLMHTAEVVNNFDPFYEEHRKLANGRPAFLVITDGQYAKDIVQSVSADQWKPYSIVAAANKYYVVGGDEGGIGGARSGKPRLLLTSVERVNFGVSPSSSPTPVIGTPSPGTGNGAAPSLSPSPVPTPFLGVELAIPTPTTTASCIGVSTRIKGRGILETVKGDPRLRLQRHPLASLRRWMGLDAGGVVAMLCMSWGNGTASAMDRLCATARHVVRWHGKLMFMQDLCSEVGGCVEREDIPINFKGACGADVIAHEYLGITMHATSEDGESAEEVAEEECLRLEETPLRWLVYTL